MITLKEQVTMIMMQKNCKKDKKVRVFYNKTDHI